MHGARLDFSLAGMGTRAPPGPNPTRLKGPERLIPHDYPSISTQFPSPRSQHLKGTYASLLRALGIDFAWPSLSKFTPASGILASADERRVSYSTGSTTPGMSHVSVEEGLCLKIVLAAGDRRRTSPGP